MQGAESDDGIYLMMVLVALSDREDGSIIRVKGSTAQHAEGKCAYAKVTSRCKQLLVRV